MENDAALVARAKSGDDAALGELVRRYLPAVFAFLFRYTGDETVAEDAAQDAFVKAWRNLSRFDAAKPFKPWMLSIARNAANDILRRKRAIPFSNLALFGRDEETPFADTIPDDEPLPPELFERKELGKSVSAALAALSERDRAVLLLRYEDELSFEDIATAMKAPMNTVKSWHRRALLRLRERLAEHAPEGHDGA